MNPRFVHRNELNNVLMNVFFRFISNRDRSRFHTFVLALVSDLVFTYLSKRLFYWYKMNALWAQWVCWGRYSFEMLTAHWSLTNLLLKKILPRVIMLVWYLLRVENSLTKKTIKLLPSLALYLLSFFNERIHSKRPLILIIELTASALLGHSFQCNQY